MLCVHWICVRMPGSPAGCFRQESRVSLSRNVWALSVQFLRSFSHRFASGDVPASRGLASLPTVDSMSYVGVRPSICHRTEFRFFRPASCGREFPGQYRRCLPAFHPATDRFTQKRKRRHAALLARCQHCPDPLAPTAAFLAARPLRHVPIHHHKPDRPFRRVVGRVHSRRRDECEIRFSVRLEPLRQHTRMLRLRHLFEEIKGVRPEWHLRPSVRGEHFPSRFLQRVSMIPARAVCDFRSCS